MALLGSLVPWVLVHEKGSRNGRKTWLRAKSRSRASIGGHFSDSGAGPPD